jgi:hypothetical protein
MSGGIIPAPATVDFFTSYTGADRAWAEWIAGQLEAHGYSSRIQAWDFGQGGNFVTDIDDALRACRRMILVLSPDYLRSVWCRNEWSSILASDPASVKRKLLPVLVRHCQPEGLLRPITRISFLRRDSSGNVGRLTEAESRNALLAGVKAPGARPASPPPFPGGPP